MCFPSSPKKVAKMLMRISLGLSLVFVGLAHYMNLDGLMLMVKDGLGPLEQLGAMWAYVLPGLMILGGGLMIFRRFSLLGAWFAGIALASIPAGMLAKTVLTGIGLEETMPPALNAFIWIIVLVNVLPCSVTEWGSCGGGMCTPGCAPGCTCGKGNCACGTGGACPGCGTVPCSCGKKAAPVPAAKPASAPVKSAPSAPSATAKKPAPAAPKKKPSGPSVPPAQA